MRLAWPRTDLSAASLTDSVVASAVLRTTGPVASAVLLTTSRAMARCRLTALLATRWALAGRHSTSRTAPAASAIAAGAEAASRVETSGQTRRAGRSAGQERHDPARPARTGAVRSAAVASAARLRLEEARAVRRKVAAVAATADPSAVLPVMPVPVSVQVPVPAQVAAVAGEAAPRAELAGAGAAPAAREAERTAAPTARLPIEPRASVARIELATLSAVAAPARGRAPAPQTPPLPIGPAEAPAPHGSRARWSSRAGCTKPGPRIPVRSSPLPRNRHRSRARRSLRCPPRAPIGQHCNQACPRHGMRT